MNMDFVHTEFFKWVMLPLIIFIARTCDVTLATLRNVFISKGMRHVVPFIGFFEVLIWLVSIRQIMQHLDNPMTYLGFAGGFAMGTYVGLRIESRLALGMQVLRIITQGEPLTLILALQTANIGMTIIDGHGAKGPVKVIYTIVRRKDIELVRKLINTHQPNAFYTIEDIRIAKQGVFRKGRREGRMDFIRGIIPETKD
jgi:uncharacterized protein YebE (UPF0316 family)